MSSNPKAATGSAAGPQAPATRVFSSLVRARAFTLLEVVIAMAMLAVVALPALGLAAMAVKQGDKRLLAGIASELKNRVEAHLAAHANVFASDFSVSLLASQDLKYIQATALPDGVDPYFKIEAKASPLAGYSTASPYQIINYIATWPISDPAIPASESAVFTSVFRK